MFFCICYVFILCTFVHYFKLKSKINMNVPLIVRPQYEKLSDEAKMQFDRLYTDRSLKKTLAIVLAIFGLHYAYLGKWGMLFFYLITLGGVGIWWIVDLFRISGVVDRRNEDTATSHGFLFTGPVKKVGLCENILPTQKIYTIK